VVAEEAAEAAAVVVVAGQLIAHQGQAMAYQVTPLQQAINIRTRHNLAL
jgi:hypothetical protein